MTRKLSIKTNEHATIDPPLANTNRTVQSNIPPGEGTTQSCKDKQANDVSLTDQLDRLQQEIVEGHRQIGQLMAATVVRVIYLGDCILKAKQLLNHGEYLNWIDSTLTPLCGIKRRTAQRYTQLAARKHELIDRARLYYGKLGEAGIADDEVLLSSMRINDAVKLLSLPKQPPSPSILEKTDGVRVNHGLDGTQRDETQLAKLAKQLVERLDGGVTCNDQFPSIVAEKIEDEDSSQPNLFIAMGGKSVNCDCATAAINRASRGDVAGVVLALSQHGEDVWMPSLDSYPRVHLRHDQQSLLAEASPIRWIFGLVASSEFNQFVECFGALGAVFVPFQPNQATD